MDSWRPRVSVVIPVLNEERFIERCIGSVVAQTYPRELIEILVADGGSTDGTRAALERLADADPRIRVIDNPRRTQAAGLNLAIAQAAGDVVARLDGHAAWGPRHLELCVELLSRTGADNVGGTMDAIGETVVGRAIARATRSPFGVGGATYRYGRRQAVVDTVWLGCFRRSALERVGLYDERFPPHEDYELNHRLRASGGRIVYSPDLATTYWTRSSWRAVATQFFRYGRAKVRVARHQPGVLRPHHLVPPALVAAAVGSLPLVMTSRCGRGAAAALVIGYGAMCAAAGLRASGGEPVPVRLRVAAAFPVLHFAWGGGFWTGVAEASVGRGA